MNQDLRNSTAGAAPPKLLIERRSDGPIVCLRLSGAIDEQFDGPGLAQTVAARWLLLDLGGIERISSFGIRQFIEFISEVSARVAGLYFVECSPKILDQFNMVANFGGPGYIISFYAPYHCDTCDHDRLRLLRTDEETPMWRAGQAPGFACPTCSNAEYFDEDPAIYFSYVAQQSKLTLPPEVSSFLRAQLSYGHGGQRKLKIEKRVDGRITYVKLSGDLDSDLRAQKLAEGLEGEVVFDLGNVMSIDPVGTAQWRKLLHLLEEKSGTSEQVDRIHLLAVPSVFLEKMGRPQDLTHKGQVLSVLVPYHCQRCRAMTQRLVDFHQHGAELRAGRVPRTQCSACGNPAVCVASETWLARLAGLPASHADDALLWGIARLQQTPPGRAQSNVANVAGLASAVMSSVHPGGLPQPMLQPGPQPMPASGWPSPVPGRVEPAVAVPGSLPGLPAAPGAQTSQRPAPATVSMARGPDTQPMHILQSRLGRVMQIPGLLPGLLVVALSLSAAIVYRILSTDGRPVSGLQVVERSQHEPPAWRVLPSKPASEAVFIGQSGLLSDRQDALGQAQDAALAEILRRLSQRLAAGSPDWQRVILPLSEPAQKELSAVQQHRIGAALLRSAGELATALAPTDTYWEKLSRGDRASLVYQATTRIVLGRPSFERLLDLYGAGETVAQARVMPYFPGLAWRYDLQAGAVIVALEQDSPMAAAGLRPGDIVISVQGRDVQGPADLQKTLEQALVDGASTGVGTVLKAQRKDDLREFTLPARKKDKGGKPAIPVRKLR